MEEYLQHMKNLRSQMNDFEEQSASISVEEEKLRSAVQSMEADLSSVNFETEGIEQSIISMLNGKTPIIRNVADKKKKIATLEAESTALSRTLELLQQESAALSEKLKDKSASYVKVMQDMRSNLQEQREWLSSFSKNSYQMHIDDDSINRSENCGLQIHSMDVNLGTDKCKFLIAELESAEAKKAGYRAPKEKLASNISKANLEVDVLKERMNELPVSHQMTGLKEMPTKELEEEQRAILSDKCGEQEYLLSIHAKIREIEGVSEIVKCICGEEYTVQPVTNHQ